MTAEIYLSAIIMLLVLATMAFLIVFWILMLIDCAKRKFKEENEKVVWIIIVAILGWIGAIIYYFVIKIKDKK